jgi:hypothetical protein
MNIFSSKYFFLIVVAVQCVLWFWVKNDPFFGDAIASTSQAATQIYNNHLSTIFYPLQADPGHPTAYSYILAIVWKIAGRTLWISHLYSCVWAIVLVYAFRKVAGALLTTFYVNISTVLVLVFPTYLAQSAMMLNTVPLMCFFLFAVYGVLTQHRAVICVASVCMCATHLQAPFLLLSLASFDVYRTVIVLKQLTLVKWLLNRWIYYTLPVIVFTTWLFVHYHHAGWLLVSPQYNDVKNLNTIGEYIKAMMLIIWRLLDYGMLPVYLVLGFGFFKQKQSRKELLQLLILIVPCCLAIAIFLSNTIGHRYFMAFGMLAILVAVAVVSQLKPAVQNGLFILLFTSLVAGNFLYYPGKTIGDATLAYRSFFPINKSIQQQYGNTVFFSHAPIANPAELMYLQAQGFWCKRLNDQPLEDIPAIVQSNINAEFSQDEIHYLTQNWFGRSYENGAVYATVFFNPKFYKQTEPSNFRQPSTVERWMLEAKANIK